MSRAFIKEDVDPPERSGRVRAPSGLPPGATNYITRKGAQRLETELARMRSSGATSEALSELQNTLASVTIVDRPTEDTEGVAFGATVTIEVGDEVCETYRIVGVDELAFEPQGVSWISPVGRALLAATRGDRVTVAHLKGAKVAAISYPTE